MHQTILKTYVHSFTIMITSGRINIFNNIVEGLKADRYIVFPRSNAVVFIFSRYFEVRRLFEGGVYSRATFINLSTIMPIIN